MVAFCRAVRGLQQLHLPCGVLPRSSNVGALCESRCESRCERLVAEGYRDRGLKTLGFKG